MITDRGDVAVSRQNKRGNSMTHSAELKVATKPELRNGHKGISLPLG